jgi:hypothetical protein
MDADKANLFEQEKTEITEFSSLLPPFPPVLEFFICVNPRPSAGNFGFGRVLPLWASRRFHYGVSTTRKWLMLNSLQQSPFFRIFPLTSILISYIIARVW